jgi:hypothetical protein
MAKSRQINTQFWRDSYITNLDPSEKLLFLYLLTNPDTNISGIYQIPIKIIAADTGFDREMIVKMLERFSTDGKVKHCDGWVAIKNFQKHQSINPKIKLGIDANEALAPSWAIAYIKPMDSLSHLNSNLNSNSNLNLNPNINDADASKSSAKPKDEEAVSTTQFLYGAILTNSNPPTWAKNPPNLDGWYKPIEALHRIDGISYCDIRAVISWCTKDSFWKSNILSGSSLREKYNRLSDQMKRGINGRNLPIGIQYTPEELAQRAKFNKETIK